MVHSRNGKVDAHSFLLSSNNNLAVVYPEAVRYTVPTAKQLRRSKAATPLRLLLSDHSIKEIVSYKATSETGFLLSERL